MEIGLGQKYLIEAVGVNVAQNTNPVDLFVVTAAAGVPVVVERIVCTSNVNAAQVQLVQLTKRSTAGSGGSSMTISPEPGSAPAASLSAQANVTTVGTSTAAFDPEYWQMFSSYEMNRRPGGLLLVPGVSLALAMPTVPAAFLASIHIEVVEVK